MTVYLSVCLLAELRKYYWLELHKNKKKLVFLSNLEHLNTPVYILSAIKVS